MTRLLRQCLGIFLALLGALHAPVAQSQYTSDLDIFSYPVGQGSQPNVLFVVDNTANWSTMFVREMQAIANTLNALRPDYFRVGLMLFTGQDRAHSVVPARSGRRRMNRVSRSIISSRRRSANQISTRMPRPRIPPPPGCSSSSSRPGSVWSSARARISA